METERVRIDEERDLLENPEFPIAKMKEKYVVYKTDGTLIYIGLCGEKAKPMLVMEYLDLLKEIV